MAFNEREMRLDFNLRHLKKFLFKQKLLYEDLQVAMLLLKKGDCLFYFDLKSTYLHVLNVAEVHHKLLFSLRKKIIVFTVLPMVQVRLLRVYKV